MRIGEELQDLRLRARLGLRELAELSGVDAGNLCHVEKGRKSLNATMAAKLERFLPGVMRIYERGQTLLPLDLSNASRRTVDELLAYLSTAAHRPEEVGGIEILQVEGAWVVRELAATA